MNSESPSTILVVDDNEAARYAKARLLQAAGFRIVEAATGNEALQLAQQGKPDLVLLDVRLPDIDGFEVCRRLRADPGTASLAIVHISASFERPEHQVRGLEGGADTFLLAPIDSTVLVATVRAMLRLRQAEQALRESDRRKDEFLAVLAHELRNPLAPLRHSLRLFQRAELQDASLESARGIMERQINQMVRLIDDLLDISRINQNKLELRREPVSLARVLEAAQEVCRPGIEAAGHQLTLTLPSQPITLFADVVRLAQVFANLLSNATKFTPPGGQIDIAVAREEDQAVVTVRDTGIGMTPSDMKAVFAMFAQARRDPEQQGGGLGIGLALVRRLVEMHGGSVAVQSDGVGRGSMFTVRLPVVDSIKPITDSAVVMPAGRSLKIVVADDNEDSAVSLGMLLESMNHIVRVAYDGVAAVEAAAAFRPDVVLLDISMPRLDGLAAAARIRSQPGLEHVVIFAMSGFGQEADRQRSEKAGINHHLVKPIDIGDLERLLAKV